MLFQLHYRASQTAKEKVFAERRRQEADAWKHLSRAERDVWKDKAIAESNAAQRERQIVEKQQSPPQFEHAGQSFEGIRMETAHFVWGSEEGNCLGQGSYGAVFLAKRKIYLTHAAAKVYDCKDVFEHELSIWKKALAVDGGGLDPPYPRVFEASGHGIYRAIVMELFDCDLRALLSHSAHAQTSATIIYQIALALKFLHRSVSIMHLDVSVRNILWQQLPKRAVLADFSLATLFPATKMRAATCCAPNYRPPELLFLAHGKIAMELINPAIDLWSFGCVLWEIIASEVEPFEHMMLGNEDNLIKANMTAYMRDIKSAFSPWSRRLSLAGEWGSALNSLVHKRQDARDLSKIWRAFEHART